MNIQDFVRVYSLRDALDIPEEVFKNRLSPEAIHATSLYDQHHPAENIEEYAQRYWRGIEDSRILTFLDTARTTWKQKEEDALSQLSKDDKHTSKKLITALEEMRKARRDENYEGLLEPFWNSFDMLEKMELQLTNDQQIAYTCQTGGVFLIARYTLQPTGAFHTSQEHWTDFSYLHTGCCNTIKRKIIVRPRACAFMQELLLQASELLPQEEKEMFRKTTMSQEEWVYWHEKGHIAQEKLFGREIESPQDEKTITGREEYADLTGAILIERTQSKERAEEFLIIDALGCKIRGEDAEWKIKSATIEKRMKELQERYVIKTV